MTNPIDHTPVSVEGQTEGEVATVQAGRGSVYLATSDGYDGFTIAVDPDAADRLAAQLVKSATEARKR